MIKRVGEKTIEVNPCPQCGRSDSVTVGQGGMLGMTAFRIKCHSCGYQVGSPDLDKASMAWNTSQVGKKVSQ